MRELNIDLETYSSEDLKKSGMYKYAEASDFAILLLAYSFDGGETKLVDIASGENVPREVFEAMDDPNILKTAWNAQFERTCLAAFYDMEVPPEQWECTMVKAMMLGLPGALGQAAAVLNLPQQKDLKGLGLIRYFSIPCKPSAANGERTRNLPHDAPDRWRDFRDYCVKDVDVEKAIRTKLSFFKMPAMERKLWCLDQRINDGGVLLDKRFIKNAVTIDALFRERLMVEATEITQLENPNSVTQLIRWLNQAIADSDKETESIDPINTENQIATLKKGDIPVLLTKFQDEAKIKRVLEIRQELAKTSVKKYISMANCVCRDGRVRQLLQFYGANRTGRWAGRLVQVQNLPQNHLKDLDLARELVRDNDPDTLELGFGNVPDTLSQLIRTSFVAGKGKQLVVADFSAIEARVIAWLANEKWRLDVFNTHGKIYEASASKMFNVPIEAVTKGSDYRQKGKISELALGYQGGVNALITMGALKMGVTDAVVTEAFKLWDDIQQYNPSDIEWPWITTTEQRDPKTNRKMQVEVELKAWSEIQEFVERQELQRLVDLWRTANQSIGQLWRDVNDAAIAAVQGTPVAMPRVGLKFFTNRNLLLIRLPSGRCLSYYSPKLKMGKFGGQALTYWGMDQTTKQWRELDTYGGKLVENIVQAIARDCLAEAMLAVADRGHKIVIHVHDEIVVEAVEDEAEQVLEELKEIMAVELPWAKGLPLGADGYVTKYYRKD